MEHLQKILMDHGPRLVETLTAKVGFSSEAAERFLPSVAGRLGELFRSGDVGDKADWQGLVGLMDTAELAKSSGIEEGQAREGLEAVLPTILQRCTDLALDPEGLSKFLGGGGGPAEGLRSIAGKFLGS